MPRDTASGTIHFKNGFKRAIRRRNGLYFTEFNGDNAYWTSGKSREAS